MASDEALHFPAASAYQLEPYLPLQSHSAELPFVTLTYATALDGTIAAAPGTRTTLSGMQSKAMTHFLRTRHDAICIGVGTAQADDPGLNSRLAVSATDGEVGPDSATAPLVSQPRPIVIDPEARWAVSPKSKVIRLAHQGKGLAPFVITATAEADIPVAQRAALDSCGGKYVVLKTSVMDAAGKSRLQWRDILAALGREGLRSIMIEGGSQILQTLLVPPSNGLVDSVIVTVAPTWLGQGGVSVSPIRTGNDGVTIPAPRLTDVVWLPLGQDVVLCGRLVK